MKKSKNPTLIICSSLAFAFGMVSWSPVQAAPPEGKMMKDRKMMMKTAPIQKCQVMKDQMEKIMADTKTQDAELATQIAAMNSAPEDKKLDLMASIVTHMAGQQAAMHSRKAEMEEKMVPHMIQHMQMGKESMSKCPMMKGMNGMDDPSTDASEAKPVEKE